MRKMQNITVDDEQLVMLKRIEGQVRGIQRMINEKRCYEDILNQFHSVVGAIFTVRNRIFKKHLELCVTDALNGKSHYKRAKKIDEIISLVDKFRSRN